jgi:ATP-binding cassette subfamily B (MDR/TAP) protein 1
MKEEPKLAGRNAKPPRASFIALFKYAECMDIFLMLFGTFGAMIMGGIQPVLFLLLGELFNNIDAEEVKQSYYDSAVEIAIYLTIFGGVFMVSSYIAVTSWIFVGSRQGYYYRRELFKSILHKDPEWYDERNVAELPGGLIGDSLKIERATGDKLIVLIFVITMVLASLIMALIVATQLTLICFAIGPFTFIGLYITSSAMEQSARQFDTSYKKAGGIAEEALTEIKTVAAHNAQEYESSMYDSALGESQKSMLINGIKRGAGIGVSVAAFFIMFSIDFRVGAQMIYDNYDNWGDGSSIGAGDVMIAIFVCMMAFNNMGTVVPCFALISEARVALYNIQTIIDAPNTLNQADLDQELEGTIEFEDVGFCYPAAKEKDILSGLSFKLNARERLGVVGSTGSGKSTIIQLILRYYDPTRGRILIDGIDITQFSIPALRKQMGLVSQEPLLFNTSIKENIRYGKLDATDDEIFEAARKASAYDFIMELPDKFDTNVGNKGSQLSGGQKQRIAVARAIIRNPKIVLLDEATSALDRQTEILVMDALTKALPESSWVIVAQNLRTIKDCDRIIMLDSGKIIEDGSHSKLVKKKKKYYHLWKMQKIQNYNKEDVKEEIQQEVLSEKMEIEETEVEVKAQKKKKENFMGRVMQYGKNDKKWIFLGCFGSVIVGVTYPLVGMFNGMQIDTLATKYGEDLIDESSFNSGMIGILTFIVFSGLMLEAVSYPKMTANLTTTIRKESFKKLLSYEIEHFDLPENNPSVISARLNTDCEKINSLGGSVFGLVLGIVSSLAVAHGVAAAFSWKLSLVTLTVIPIFIFAVGGSFVAQMQGFVKFNTENTTALASDFILNYRTVKAFNLEDTMYERFHSDIFKAMKDINCKAHFAGISYGLGYGLIFLCYALLYWYGAKLFYDGELDFRELITATLTAMSGSDAFFIAGVYAPDLKQGVDAAKKIFKILDYVPKIDIDNPAGVKNVSLKGEIEIQNVVFNYPMRNYKALNDVSFKIEAGQSFGVIGRTGSGKSTIMQLLLRFYDVKAGSIKIDGIDIKDYNIRWLRSQISIVSQEPVLFTGSISDNIRYGYDATDVEVYEAAEKAQALNFINDHPRGFERNVGMKGTKLSGGQKQRIAIARAIIRNPKILLLDEATSALDPKTEQELLNILAEIMRGRTSITIAHRLKTVSDVDRLVVFDNGKLIEIGTPQELIAQKGYFYSLMSQLQ